MVGQQVELKSFLSVRSSYLEVFLLLNFLKGLVPKEGKGLLRNKFVVQDTCLKIIERAISFLLHLLIQLGELPFKGLT